MIFTAISTSFRYYQPLINIQTHTLLFSHASHNFLSALFISSRCLFLLLPLSLAHIFSTLFPFSQPLSLSSVPALLGIWPLTHSFSLLSPLLLIILVFIHAHWYGYPYSSLCFPSPREQFRFKRDSTPLTELFYRPCCFFDAILSFINDAQFLLLAFFICVFLFGAP